MENICEFCTILRPVVYCKADAAYLCLSCDAKVHSANALSNRHLRTLLCDSCRCHLAYTRCLDHQLFVCQGCDQSLHGLSPHHKRQVVSSYTGCPSAKDFAALWGFKLDELDRSAALQPSVANFDIPGESCLPIRDSSITSKVSCSSLVSGAESDVGSGSERNEISCNGQQQQNTHFILQQILHLKRLQLNEDHNSAVMPGQDQGGIYSSIFDPLKELDNNLHHLQHLQDLGTNLQQSDSLLEELKVDSLPLSFTQTEPVPLSSTSANPLLGESLWQCKSVVQSSQLWSQNMQDLGVCEDIVSHDEFKIPDVDITFRNFEELFGGDPEPIRELLDEKDASCSSVEKDMSVDKSDNGNARAKEDTSVASSVHMNEDKYHSNKVSNCALSLGSPRTIRPSYSTMSFSISRLSAESCGTEYLDSGLSPHVTGGEGLFHSHDPEVTHQEARENAVMRYKEKKKARMHENQIRYAPRKARSDARKQRNGQSVKTEDNDSDIIDATRSY